MNKKCVLMGMAIVIGTLSGGNVVNAATGVVNMNRVLAASRDFQNAQQSSQNVQPFSVVEWKAKVQEMGMKQGRPQYQIDEIIRRLLPMAEAAEARWKRAQAGEPQINSADLSMLNNKLKWAVERAAKDKNIDTVVVNGGLLYGQVDVDLTDDVIAYMQ